ncbi:class I SAM-dependent methyltransferase [bacterium]|nr:class I SAM-dependent methyltransferase [bacterium]
MFRDDPEVQVAFDTVVQRDRELKMLEIGCGSASHLDFPRKPYIVGLDVSEEQLKRNDVIDEKIHADIETYELLASEYDVVVCWWLLEHLSDPISVLEKCEKSLKPGGVLVVAAPNVRSVKGLITKFTPHWFHVWVYRYVFGVKDAGKNETVPFKTYLRWNLSGSGLKHFAHNAGLDVVRLGFHENYWQAKLRRENVVLDVGWKIAGFFVRVVSLGFVEPDKTDLTLVLKKQAAPL